MLAKFLQFLAKIGPDLYIEAVAEGLILGTANSSSSGFARVQLWPNFFIEYEVLPAQVEAGENCCRVSLKSCAAIFRSMKNVETCDIRMNQAASRLIIQLHCRENTTKTHFITILEQETLTAPSRPADSTVNTCVDKYSYLTITDHLLVTFPVSPHPRKSSLIFCQFSIRPRRS